MGGTSDRRRLISWQALLLALLITSYSGYYLCRSNLSVTLPLIQDYLGSRGIDPGEAKVQLGRIVSWGVLAYALGKFLAGGLADKLGGRRTFLSGMLGSVCFTMLFAVSGTLPLFTLAWIGNRLFQSFGWPGMVRLGGRWFSYSRYGLAMGLMSLSYLFGDAAARWFLGLLLDKHLSWSVVFVIAGAVLFGLFLLNLFLLKESPREVGLVEPDPNPLNLYGKGGEQASSGSLWSLLQPLLFSPLRASSWMALWKPLWSLLQPLMLSRAFWLVCFLSLGLTFLRETFNTWTPTYFKEAFGMTAGSAATKSALYPLCGGVAVILAGFGSDWLGRGGRATIILVGLVLTTVALIVLGKIGSENSAVTMVAVIGFLMLAPYSYLAGAIALDFGGKKGSATACGIIDGIGYLGAILSGEGVARLSVQLGWSGAFHVLAGAVGITTLAALAFWFEQRSLRDKAPA